MKVMNWERVHEKHRMREHGTEAAKTMQGMYGAERVRSENDDQTEEQYRAEIWRELEWVRYQKHYVPGWSYYAYLEMFADKPKKWMRDLQPQQPRPELLRWLNRRNAAFKKGKTK
jgi:hypothetical protein